MKRDLSESMFHSFRFDRSFHRSVCVFDTASEPLAFGIGIVSPKSTLDDLTDTRPPDELSSTSRTRSVNPDTTAPAETGLFNTSQFVQLRGVLPQHHTTRSAVHRGEPPQPGLAIVDPIV